MPNRMLRDYTDSARFDGISAEAERLFVRLLTKADDYGRFHSDPRLIKAGCFPLIDNLRTNDVTRWLDELSTRKLILRYEADGRHVLSIVSYGQRLKDSKAKFPPMDGMDATWLPLHEHFREVPGSSGKSRLEEKRREEELEEEKEGKGRVEVPPLAGSLFSIWNTLDFLPKIQSISEKRKAVMAARMKEPYFRDNWQQALGKIKESEFLLGKNDKGWKADIDWFLRPDSVVKIMEGKYLNGKQSTLEKQTFFDDSYEQIE